MKDNYLIEVGLFVKWTIFVNLGQVIAVLLTKLIDIDFIFTEIVPFTVSITIAALANLLFISREREITVKIVLRHLILAFFVGWLGYLLGVHFNLTIHIRLFIVSILSFLSEYFLIFISEKYPKIFEAGFKLGGLDLKDKDNEGSKQNVARRKSK